MVGLPGLPLPGAALVGLQLVVAEWFKEEASGRVEIPTHLYSLFAVSNVACLPVQLYSIIIVANYCLW